MARNRIGLAVMGIDQHENGIVAVGRILREAQMETRYMGTLLTPEQVIDGALLNECQVIGISCHSWEYLTLVPELVKRLRERKIAIPVVIGGSVITSADAAQMRAIGVAAVFGAGSTEIEIIDAVRAVFEINDAAAMGLAGRNPE